MTSEPTPRGSALFSRLRADTSEQHTALEALVPLMSPAVTREDYVHFLSVSHAFHSPVEQELRRLDGLPEIVQDLNQRWKSARLLNDLSALGCGTVAFLQDRALQDRELRDRAAEGVPSRMEGRAAVPEIKSIERALGVMYVLEGSTLGGQYLHRHLSKVLPVELAEADTFLNCYGPKTGSMWKSFQQDVERVASSLDADAVVDAARESFLVLTDWFGSSRDASGAAGGRRV